MNNISRFRLLALRGMYLFIAVGLTLSTWAEVVNVTHLASALKYVMPNGA